MGINRINELTKKQVAEIKSLIIEKSNENPEDSLVETRVNVALTYIAVINARLIMIEERLEKLNEKSN
jgi:hypothetical protein